MQDDDNFGRSAFESQRSQLSSLEEQNRFRIFYEKKERDQKEHLAREFLRNSKEFDILLRAHNVEDERIRSFVVEAAAKDIAEQFSKAEIEPKELARLMDAAVGKGLKQEELEREQIVAKELEAEREATEQLEQQLQRHDEQWRRLQLEPRQRRYFGELHESHRIVGEEIAADRTAPPEQNNFENEQNERSHLGRYAVLEATRQLLDVELRQREESTARQTAEMERTTSGDSARSAADQVELKGEQTDSRRETDDRSRLRQARARAFGREIEEAFHKEMEQDGGRELGE